MPVAVSIAARTAPVPGHWPSGIGKLESRVAPINSAPRRTAWVATRSSSNTRSSCAATTTTSARVANGVWFTIRRPASATWSTSACEPTTYALPRPPLRSASVNCTAAPALSTSSSEAWNPSRHSLRTNPSGGWRTSLVRNRTDLLASRSAAIASAAPSIGSSPSQTHPSRSSRKWS